MKKRSKSTEERQDIAFFLRAGSASAQLSMANSGKIHGMGLGRSGVVLNFFVNFFIRNGPWVSQKITMASEAEETSEAIVIALSPARL